MKKILIALFLSVILMSCTLFQEELNVASGINIEELGESLQLSWSSVEKATSYTIYFTDDGSEPSLDSSSLSSTTNSYRHESLDPEKTYKYKISAAASNFKSSLSESTSGNLPKPVITYTGNFSLYKNNQILVRLLDVPYNSNTSSVVGSTTLVDQAVVTPDSAGDVSVRFGFDRDKYIGISLAIDTDSSGTLSSGDIVTGSGSTGYFGYTYWHSLKTTSFTFSRDWNEYSSNHIY